MQLLFTQNNQIHCFFQVILLLKFQFFVKCFVYATRYIIFLRILYSTTSSRNFFVQFPGKKTKTFLSMVLINQVISLYSSLTTQGFQLETVAQEIIVLIKPCNSLQFYWLLSCCGATKLQSHFTNWIQKSNLFHFFSQDQYSRVAEQTSVRSHGLP